MIRRLLHDGAEARAKRVAIIGGGFSGAAVALHLARLATDRTDLVVYEPAHELGSGVAYGATQPYLRLNVPAGKLSILPDRPRDFLRWLHEQGIAADAGDFMPRAQFGRYVRSRLDTALAGARGRVAFGHVHARVDGVRIGRHGVLVEPLGEEATAFDHAVLALGHGPGRVPGALQPYLHDGRILRSPWNEAAMMRIARKARRVLLVGTGLTLCDAAIMLVEMGFGGALLAVSRRGLLPQPHAPSDAATHARWAAALPPGDLRSLRRAVVRRARSHEWRGVIDAVRPHTSRLWSSFGQWDRERFARRLTPYWDVHRHRLAPQVGLRLAELMDAGTLRVRRGHVLAARPLPEGLSCTIGVPGGGPDRSERFDADAVILCTGPESDPGRWQSPLIDGLLDRGLARLDPRGLGLQTDAGGMLLGLGGTAQDGLSTLGPLRRGELWESTAVPEIHVQAEALARRIHMTGRNPSSHAWMAVW